MFWGPQMPLVLTFMNLQAACTASISICPTSRERKKNQQQPNKSGKLNLRCVSLSFLSFAQFSHTSELNKKKTSTEQQRGLSQGWTFNKIDNKTSGWATNTARFQVKIVISVCFCFVYSALMLWSGKIKFKMHKMYVIIITSNWRCLFFWIVCVSLFIHCLPNTCDSFFLPNHTHILTTEL